MGVSWVHFLSLFALVHLAQSHSKKKKKSYHFVQVTDIHMEPFFNPEFGHKPGNVCRMPEAFNKSQCVPFEISPVAETYPLGRLNCDGPASLLHSLLTKIEDESKHTKPEFAVFTGDIPSHQLSCQRHQVRTIEFVINQLATKLKPAVGDKIYPVMGNNDYFPNYNISFEPNNAWQELVASIYERNGILAGEQLKTFRRGGYLSAKPKPGLRLITLNTVILSEKVLNWGKSTKVEIYHVPEPDKANYEGNDAPFKSGDEGADGAAGWKFDTSTADKKEMVSCDDRPEDPYGQIAWFEAELASAEAAGERVIIAGHIPPGNKVGDNNFCEQHTTQLNRITKQYQHLIEVQIYGDHSNDEFRMFWEETPEIKAISSVLVSAGVTPRKHCNPSWRMYEVTQDHDVYDFTQYYLPLEESNLQLEAGVAEIDHGDWAKNAMMIVEKEAPRFWKKQYSFRQQYGVGLEPSNLETLFEAFQSDPKLLGLYVNNMFSQTAGTEDYFDYVCDMRYLDKLQNQACAAKGRITKIDEPLGIKHAPIVLLAANPSDSDNGNQKIQVDQHVFLLLQGGCTLFFVSSLLLFAKAVQLTRQNADQESKGTPYLLLA